MKPARLAFVLLLLSLALNLLPPAALAADNPAPVGIPPRDSVRTRCQPPAFPAPGATLHVSPQGNDSWSGSEAKPFATLERCRDAIRALKTKAGLPAGGILVLVHGGEYPVTQTFTLSRDDSGTDSAPVRYAAAPGEKPLFSGGKHIVGWRHLADADSFPLLPRESREKIWIADLKASGIDSVLPLNPGGYGSGAGFTTRPMNELFFNGRPMQLARSPNGAFVQIKDVAVPDGTHEWDRHGSKTGIFYYEGDLPRKWAGEPDLFLYGYWYWDWSDSYEHVASIDPDRHLITLAKPWHTSGYRVGAQFYAVNALSELDAPGEWYLDRARKVILFYPPADPGHAAIELSLTAAPFLAMDNLSHVSFQGLTWELGSADAIHVTGGDHCLFAGCTVMGFAGDGVKIDGGHDGGLLSCDISTMGRGGVILSGGDRKTLEPGHQFVENCDIHDLSRIDHTYTPAILLSGAGIRIAHNRLHDILSSAMRVEGNDQLIEYNEVYNVVTESDDQGGADMWGNPTYRGNIYRFNYWHHIGNWSGAGKPPRVGQAGVRLDDAISGTLIYGNVFERCSTANFGGVQINGGKDNIIQNNLFIDCAACVSCSPWPAQNWRDFVKKALVEHPVDSALYTRRYPALSTLPDNPNTNHVFNNATLRCANFLVRAPEAVEAKDNGLPLAADFSMKTAPAIFKHPGLDPIPLGEIGLYTDAWRKSNPEHSN